MKYDLVAFAYDKRGKLLSVGRNSYIKTHPLQARFAKECGVPQKIYLHAEIDALVKARSPVHRLFIMRARKDGSYGSAKPCAVCLAAIKFFNVIQVDHT